MKNIGDGIIYESHIHVSIFVSAQVNHNLPRTFGVGIIHESHIHVSIFASAQVNHNLQEHLVMASSKSLMSLFLPLFQSR